MRKKFVAWLLFTAIVTGLIFGQDKSSAADAALTEKVFSLKEFGTLHLAFPEAWADSITWKNEMGAPVDELRFLPRSGSDFAVIVEVIHLGDKGVQNFDPRANVADFAKLEMTNAVEKTLAIHEFKGSRVTGSWFSLTDKTVSATDPKPGEYKYLTQGYAKLDSVVLALRVVSNRANGDESALALDMLKSARYAPLK